MLSRLLGTERLLLASPLSEAECRTRLRSSIRSRWNIFGAGAVVGRVDVPGFKIWNTGRSGLRLVLHARLQGARSGTLIQCRLGRNPAQFLVLIPFVAMLVGMISIGVGDATSAIDQIFQVLFCAVFLAFLATIFIHQFIRSNDDRDILLDFLARVIEARPIIGSAPSEAVDRGRV